MSIDVTHDHRYVSFVVVKSVLFSFMTYHQIFNMSNIMNPTSRAGTSFPSRANPHFSGVRAVQSSVFWTIVCLFLHLLLVIALSALLRNMASDYPFAPSNFS